MFGAGGFRDRVRSDDHSDAKFWDPSTGNGGAAACVSAAGGGDGARRRAVDFGTERVVSRRGFDHSVHRAILDAGVAGGVSEFAGAGGWRWLYGLNPMAGVIDGFRWALTGTGKPPGAQMAISAVVVLLLVLGGLVFFQRVEGTVADRV